MTSARISTLRQAAFFLCLPGLVAAHVRNDRVYPILYLSDEALEEIQLDDGIVDEWYDLAGEPNLIISDFTDKKSGTPLDPSDLDFRIWLAWHDDPVRLYVAFVGSDDVYENTHDYDVETNFRNVIWKHDSIGLIVDGDHSGGGGFTGDPTEEDVIEANGNAQLYSAISQTPAGPNIDGGGRASGTPPGWIYLPPYADGGGGVFSEAPVISVIELYVTPFDSWEGWDYPGQMEVSQLAAGKVIGFGIIVYDHDPGEQEWWTPGRMQWQRAWRRDADGLLDGLLLRPDLPGPGDSAVESVSWGRIKAALEVK